MKHIQIDFHFVLDLVQQESLQVRHVNTRDQLVDFLTKPLSRQHTQLLRNKIELADGSPILWGCVTEDHDPLILSWYLLQIQAIKFAMHLFCNCPFISRVIAEDSNIRYWIKFKICIYIYTLRYINKNCEENFKFKLVLASSIWLVYVIAQIVLIT